MWLVTSGTKLLTGWIAALRVSGVPGRLRAGTALVARREFSIVIAGLSVAAGAGSQLTPLAATYVLLTAMQDVLASIEIPVFLWSGWYDNLLANSLGCWQGMEAADAAAGRTARDAAHESGTLRRPCWLTLGPNDHETSPDFTGCVGRIGLPEGPRTWDRVQASSTRTCVTTKARPASPPLGRRQPSRKNAGLTGLEPATG